MTQGNVQIQKCHVIRKCKILMEETNTQDLTIDQNLTIVTNISPQDMSLLAQGINQDG